VRFKKYAFIACFSFTLLLPKPASADFWGGDVVVLTQILANALQQLAQLQQLLSTGSDTLNLMRDINSGVRTGLTTIQMLNPKFNPGLYGNLSTANQVMDIITNLYGSIPATTESQLQAAQDQSASESIAMNGTLYQVADQADETSREIIAQSQVVSPQGAAKLTAQSIAVLIGVTTQVLRTNSMMLKMMGENMALTNRNEKLQSQQFKTEYEGVSGAIQGLPATDKLPTLNSGD